jgi:ABC-2 type transport system permease protein
MRVTPMPAWSYVTTKVVASMLIILPVELLVELVGLSFGGVRLSLGQWVVITAILWLTALPFAVLGVFVGFLVTAETAYPVVTALMFILGYFGGLFNPVSDMPHVLQTVARILPTFHQTSLTTEALSGQTLAAGSWLILAAYTAVLGLALLWRHRAEEARGLA